MYNRIQETIRYWFDKGTPHHHIRENPTPYSQYNVCTYIQKETNNEQDINNKGKLWKKPSLRALCECG